MGGGRGYKGKLRFGGFPLKCLLVGLVGGGRAGARRRALRHGFVGGDRYF